MFKKILLSLAIILSVMTEAKAQPTIVTPQCFRDAAVSNHVSLSVALALLQTEGGRPGTMHRNSNGSYDLGVMQVNDRTWVVQIARDYFNGDVRKAYETVRDNGCFNAMIGTRIFATYLRETNGNYMKAIGYYNSHTPDKMRIYQSSVLRKYLLVKQVFSKHHLINENGE